MNAGRRHAVADALLAVLLAPPCAVCGDTLESPLAGCVCPACWAGLLPLAPPLCDTCGDPLPAWRAASRAASRCARCRRGGTTLAHARAAGAYAGSLRAIIHALKYDGRRSLAAPLGRVMREAGGGVLDDVSCAVPVPLHPWRRIQRGFNQAADLAAALDVPVVHALSRTRATAPQTGLSATARRRNVRGAFTLSWRMTRRRRSRWIENGIVLLVDDVRTTGATLDACAGVLVTAGAREVRALTAAAAVIGRDAGDTAAHRDAA